MPATTTYTTSTVPVGYTTTTAVPTTSYQTYTTSAVPATTTTYTTGPSYVASSSGYNAGTFVSGAHGTGSNYVYTSGGPLETSTYTTGGYAQPLSTHGYVTKDGTHLSTAGNVVGGTTTTYTSSSQVKGNQSYQTNYA